MSLILSAQNNSLLAGRTGYLLYILSRDKHSQKKWDIIEDILANIGQNINPSYGVGITGVLNTFNLLVKKNVIDGEHFEEVFDLFNPYLDSSCSIYIQQGSTDFLFGACGIIYYFLCNPSVSSLTINKHIYQLLSSPNIYKEIGFEPNRNFEHINMGIPHGIVGTGLVLLRALYDSRVIHKEMIRGALQKTENFILSTLNQNKNCLFPIKIEKNSLQKINSETLSWSYGDLGILLFLMEFAIFENDQIKLENYRKLVDLTLSRFLNQKKSDSGLRHGTAGFIILLNHLARIHPDHLIKEFYNMQLKAFYEDIPTVRSKYENFEGLLGARAVYYESKTQVPIDIFSLFLM